MSNSNGIEMRPLQDASRPVTSAKLVLADMLDSVTNELPSDNWRQVKHVSLEIAVRRVNSVLCNQGVGMRVLTTRDLELVSKQIAQLAELLSEAWGTPDSQVRAAERRVGILCAQLHLLMAGHLKL